MHIGSSHDKYVTGSSKVSDIPFSQQKFLSIRIALASFEYSSMKSMKANFKASSKQNHLIHYRSEYRPLQNPLWDISVPTINNS